MPGAVGSNPRFTAIHSNGVVPQLSLSGSGAPGGQLNLDVTGSTPGALVALFLGGQSAELPAGLGGQATLLVSPFNTQILGALSAGGTLSLSANIPASILPGTLVAQSVIVDPAAPSGLGFALTNAVQLDIQ